MTTWDQARIWDEETAAGYDTPGTGMFADAVLGPTLDRLAELAAGGPVLEFAVGTGRVAIPLAARGVPVTGLELSEPMVARLRAKVGPAEVPVVIGDMATTRVPGEFSLVVLIFNTISNLLDQEQQVACFANAARHLRPGGRFVIELWVPELRSLAPGRRGVVFHADVDGPDVGETGVEGADADGSGEHYLGVDTFDLLTQRIVSHHVRFGPGRDARIFRSPHRYIWPSELDLMARLAGFGLEHRWADWDRSAFTAESGSHVSVYRLG